MLDMDGWSQAPMRTGRKIRKGLAKFLPLSLIALSLFGAVAQGEVVAQGSDGSLKKQKVLRPYTLAELESALGIPKARFKESLSLAELEIAEISYLPTELFQHLADRQLQQMIDKLGAAVVMRLLPLVSRRNSHSEASYKPSFRRLMALARFSPILQPSPGSIGELPEYAYFFLDPITALQHGGMTFEKFRWLIRFHENAVGENDLPSCEEQLRVFGTLLNRSDLDFPIMFSTLAVNCRTLTESIHGPNSSLPEITHNRLKLIYAQYLEYNGSAK